MSRFSYPNGTPGRGIGELVQRELKAQVPTWNGTTGSVQVSFWVRKYDAYNGGVFVSKWGAVANEWVIGMTGSNQVFIGANGGFFVNGGGLTTGRWQHIFYSNASGHDFWLDTAYQGGAGHGGHTTTNQPLEVLYINGGCSAHLAHLAIWKDGIIDATKLGMLWKGVNPLLIEPHRLLGYWPLMGKDTVERDLSGNNADLYVAPYNGLPAADDNNPAVHSPYTPGREVGTYAQAYRLRAGVLTFPYIAGGVD